MTGAIWLNYQSCNSVLSSGLAAADGMPVFEHFPKRNIATDRDDVEYEARLMMRSFVLIECNPDENQLHFRILSCLPKYIVISLCHVFHYLYHKHRISKDHSHTSTNPRIVTRTKYQTPTTSLSNIPRKTFKICKTITISKKFPRSTARDSLAWAPR